MDGIPSHPPIPILSSRSSGVSEGGQQEPPPPLTLGEERRPEISDGKIKLPGLATKILKKPGRAASAGDTGSSPGLGRSHMPQSN